MLLSYTIAMLLASATFGSDDFDYFSFALDWPGDFCLSFSPKQKCEVPKDVTDWTIHGLWPDRDSGGYPSDCPGAKFELSKLDPIINQLEVSWPNMLMSTEKDSFWYHEWTKHGTCVAEKMTALDTQLKYFSKVLDLRKQVDIQRALNDAGITPDASTTYRVNDLETALTNGFGVPKAALLECTKVNNRFYLHEIRVCMSKSFAIISCPEKLTVEDISNAFGMSLDRHHPEPETEPCPSGQPIHFLPVKTAQSQLQRENSVKNTDQPTAY